MNQSDSMLYCKVISNRGTVHGTCFEYKRRSNHELKPFLEKWNNDSIVRNIPEYKLVRCKRKEMCLLTVVTTRVVELLFTIVKTA